MRKSNAAGVETSPCSIQSKTRVNSTRDPSQVVRTRRFINLGLSHDDCHVKPEYKGLRRFRCSSVPLNCRESLRMGAFRFVAARYSNRVPDLSEPKPSKAIFR